MRRSHPRPRHPLRSTLLALGLVLAAGPAAGQTLADYDYDQLRFRGIGFDVGYLWSERIQDTQRFTVRVDLGYMGPGVRIVPSISYWSSELKPGALDAWAARLNDLTGATLTGADLAPIEWSDVSLSLDGHFVWSAPLGVFTYVGLGGSVHALNGRGPAVDGTFVEDLLDDFTAGLDGLAGLEFELEERLRLYAEGRYTLMTSLQYTSIRVGAQFMFSRGGAEVGAVAPPPAPGEGRVSP